MQLSLSPDVAAEMVLKSDISSNSSQSNRSKEAKSSSEAGPASQTKPKSHSKSSPSTNMSCELCSVNFTFFKRKKYCVECQRYFCSTCLPKPPSSAPPGRKCSKCRLLLSGCFTRTDLQNYKVKDIRCFLKVKNISMAGCREKHDLVELVLTHFCTQQGNRTAGLDDSEHELLVRQMAAHMRNVSFVHEDGPGILSSDSSNSNSPVREQRRGSDTQQASRTTATSAAPVSSSPSATTATNPAFASSSSAIANSTTSAPTISSSSSTTTATARASSSPTAASTAAAPGDSASSSAQSASTVNNAAPSSERREDESSNAHSSGQGIEDDLEERLNNLNTDRLRDLLEAMERLQETFAASQEEEEDAPPAPSVRRTQLDDVTAVEDVENLTIRQLKELLVNNFVDYRGCCERSELVEKVKNLWLDHQENVAIAVEIQEEEEAEAAFISGKKAGKDCGKDSSVPEEESSGVESERTGAAEAKDPNVDADKSNGSIPQHSTSFVDSTDPSAQQEKSAEDSAETGTAAATTQQSNLLAATPGGATASSSPRNASSPSRRARNQNDSLCHICMDSLADCILLECGHMVTCTQCGKRLANCPICRQYISRVVRVFRS